MKEREACSLMLGSLTHFARRFCAPLAFLNQVGYRLWDAHAKKVYRSRDPVFNEAKFYKDRNSTK
ncbi:hypothetical protein HanRHA438_Chr02g0086791 [Helianthus annuus]|nr:hypothetical protein HanRHA438_Chr02g0086791 [Helianthus annuus]